MLRSIGEYITSDIECQPSIPRTEKQRIVVNKVWVSPNPEPACSFFPGMKILQIDQISVYDINGKLIIKKKSDPNSIKSQWI
ncbi:MAG: hypothetical protein IPF52_11135 [Saprospiraceae bacterium]|nr:hypothetical protein [Saprospiraceae bacterium]